MQGFIVNINKVHNEDLIVSILTKNRLKTTYRFYGSRHSTINLGYMIDFEIDKSPNTSLLQLRNIIHLAKSWNLESGRFYIWQQFVKLFYTHLRDVEEIDKFYFELLQNCSNKWHKQNPKRVAIEAYIELLKFEGRLHDFSFCFLCERKIEEEDIAFARAFLPSHSKCIHDKGFDAKKIKKLFLNNNSFYLDDEDINYLYEILCKGL